jgi:RHS repeat-associated protein
MELLRYYYYTDFAFTPTMDRYFYHPDHLGSSSWITDNTGRPIQHLHYLPFGEDWVDQRNSSWNAPYTFSGKEKDIETGYGYFGARYYDSGLSIWLSVDPMSDKYPHQTNYVYCSNNPIRIIDPNGEDEYEFDGAGNLKNVKATEYDSFHKIDADGKRTESLFFERKIVNGEFEIDGKTKSSNYLQIDNGNDADEVFSFLSDHVEVEGGEFSNSYVRDNLGKYTNLIGADINATVGESYSVSNLLKSEKFNVKSSIHNH